MSVLKIATYSLDTRWFTAVAATLMIAFISHWYGCAVIVPWFFIASLVIFLSVAIFKATQTVLFNKDTLNELFNPEKTLNLFTIVVAINFAGICFSKLFHLHTTASIFWYVSISLWLSVSLFSFSILFLYHKSEDRKIEEIFHGGWFFATAGTQSTAFLGVVVAEHATRHVMLIQLFSFALWSSGAALYLIFMVLIIMRLIFCSLRSNTALSPYWMNAGAAALTALTGSTLYQYINTLGGPFVDFLPFLKGISLFFWSAGLWWLPYLIVLAVRKQAYSDEGLVFTVGYWEIVFTLGLYASSTIQLVELFKGQYLDIVSVYFYVAFIALWCFSSVFTIIHLVSDNVQDIVHKKNGHDIVQ
jgi:tellurite resistance protein TehA-like permease